MKQFKILAISLALHALVGCGGEEIPSEPLIPGNEDPGLSESIVLDNCMVVQEALRRFSEENKDIFPRDVDSDSSRAGHTLLDLLSDGPPLENPYTGENINPVTGRADTPGTIGYEPIYSYDLIAGYLITGYGADSVIVELTNINSAYDAQVIANCLTAQIAADECHSQYGRYPVDALPYWASLKLYLRRNYDIENPYTGERCNPVSRTASAPGELGYTIIQENGAFAGYVITGYANDHIIKVLSNIDCTREEAILASDCRTIQLALEAFANENGSLYPKDIRYDRTPSGKYVRDFLEDGQWPTNPYTGAINKPVNRSAGYIGEIGYEVIELGGWNVGYILSCFGENEAIAVLTNIEDHRDAQVRLNCLYLHEAVEEFTSLNDGIHPENVDSHRAQDGRTVIDMLPRGRLLQNPFTGEQVEPANYTATFPGEVGYTRIEYDENNWPYPHITNTGYVISGQSESSMEVIINNFNLDPREANVLSNCRTVQIAIEEFARLNNGIYPSNVDVDSTPSGETVIDLLPGGRRLTNPITTVATEPVDAAAAQPGEVGVVPVVAGGVNIGYTITGNGHMAGNLIYQFQHLGLRSERPRE